MLSNTSDVIKFNTKNDINSFYSGIAPGDMKIELMQQERFEREKGCRQICKKTLISRKELITRLMNK